VSDRVQAAIYCRISLAAMGDTTKVDEQERQCREVAERRGWEVGHIYTDNSKSAWQRNRKRPGWDQMLAGVAAGRFGAIVSYWGDRIVRQPRDLEDLLDLREGRSLKLASVMGEYDFDNKDHRMMMRWEVARACNESDTISQRKKNANARLRREGLARPGGPGGRCFGFETDGVTHRADETEVIRAAAAAVLAGQSLGSVTRELAADGVKTVSGRPMHQTGLRRILTVPRMAALMPDGVSPAAWEAVLDRATWEALLTLISANVPVKNAGRGALHLLSGIAKCGLCDHPLWSGRNDTIPAYKCHGCGRIGRSIRLLDAYVSTRVTDRLANPENPDGRIPEGPGLASEFAALTRARAEIEEVLADHTRGNLTALISRLDSVDRRLAELRQTAGDDARARLVAAHSGITPESFAAQPLSVQRSLVQATYEVTVLPASRRGAGFNPADVRMTAR
jgi:DNA invertase Pin-like site-specific DNA recombinase